MALDPTISLNAQAPSFDTALKPVASLLGIAGAQQQLQTGRLQQGQLQSQLEERQNLANIDWNKFRDKDGNLDPVAAGNAALQASPAFYGPQLAKQFNDVAKDQITIKQGLQNLNKSQREDIGSGLGALSMDPQLSPSKVLDWAAQYSQQNPAAAPLLMTALKHAPSDPAGLKQWLITSRNSVIAPATQTTNTMTVNDGNSTHFVQTSPYQPGVAQEVGKPITNQVGPMQREEVQADALGNRYIVQRGANGAILNTRPVPGSYNPLGGTPGTGPVNMPPGGAGAVDDAQKEVTAARAAANQAPVLHDLNRSIIDLVDKGVTTGSASAVWSKAAQVANGVFGTNVEFGDNTATNYNTLGKLLERSALTAAQGMGPHTNAGLEAQVRANGSLDYTPQAIRKIAVLNDALTSGAEHYRSGLEQALQTSGQNPAVKRVFDQKWAQNFDPRIMRLENAAASGDKKEIDAVMKDLGGSGSKAAQELRAKAANLQTLISKGHL
jgi:hypothetical protein